MRVSLIVAAMLLAAGAGAQNNAAEAMLRAAMDKETVDGDLKSAIEQYKKVVARSGASREVMAKALVRLGICYERQGDAEARKAFERVVREFGDQAEAVKEARGRLSATRVATPSGLTVRQVWTGPDVDASGQISPDGRFLSFIYYRNGEELAVRDLATGENRILTHHIPGGAPDDADDIVWSSDGKKLAFSFGNFHQIRLINLAGTGTRTLWRTPSNDEFAWPLDWSPEGKRVLIIRHRNDPAAGRLVWLDCTDGSEQPIVPAIRYRPLSARVSPDGRYIAFGPGRTPDGPHEVHLVASDGSGETVLSAHPAGEYPVAWSPDGKYVVMLSMRTDTPGLWAIPVAGGRAQGAPVLLQRDLDGWVSPLGMTRSGALYYMRRTGTSDVYTASMDPATGKVTSAPVPIPLARSGRNFAPRWSPDGRRILVTWHALRNKHEKEPSIISFDTGKEQRLRPKGEIRGAGWCWVDDGASALTNYDQGMQITRVKLATGEMTTVAEGPAGSMGAFTCSADGKLLAIVDYPKRAVKLRDLGSGSEKEVYSFIGKGNVFIPEISPDGSQVAFLANTEDGAALLVIPASGGKPRELTRVKSPVEFQRMKGLAWSPDNRFVYYLKRADAAAQHELFRIPASGGQEESTGLKANDLRDINIAPNSAHIAFSIGGQRSEIWAMENFLPAAK